MSEGIKVTRVTIFNFPSGDYSWRLSNSVVSLLNYQGASLKTYTIGVAYNVPIFDINFIGENGVLIPPTTSPTTSSPSTSQPTNLPTTSPTTSKPTLFPTPAPTTISPTFDATLVWRVRVQQPTDGSWLHMREVEVFDQDNVNKALDKPATQSSTDSGRSASYAVDGSLDTMTFTYWQKCKYRTY